MCRWINTGPGYHGAMDSANAAPTGGTVLLAAPRGYCAGVERAVDAVERALAKHGAPVYVRKQIVHNLHVVRDLESKGAIFVDEETEVPAGAVVVLSAHGVAPEVYANSAARDLEVIDATCPLVTKVHVEARRFAAGRPHDRADRPRRTRGGRGHERPGARAHDPGAVARRGPHRRGPRPRATCATSPRPRCRVDETNEIVAHPPGAVPRDRGPAARRHLLRDPEPPGRREGARPAAPTSCW